MNLNKTLKHNVRQDQVYRTVCGLCSCHCRSDLLFPEREIEEQDDDDDDDDDMMVMTVITARGGSTGGGRSAASGCGANQYGGACSDAVRQWLTARWRVPELTGRLPGDNGEGGNRQEECPRYARSVSTHRHLCTQHWGLARHWVNTESTAHRIQPPMWTISVFTFCD